MVENAISPCPTQALIAFHYRKAAKLRHAVGPPEFVRSPGPATAMKWMRGQPPPAPARPTPPDSPPISNAFRCPSVLRRAQACSPVPIRTARGPSAARSAGGSSPGRPTPSGGWPGASGRSVADGSWFPPRTAGPSRTPTRCRGPTAGCTPAGGHGPGPGLEVRRGALAAAPDVALALLDVSEGGLRVRVRGRLRPGDRVLVNVLPPGGAWSAGGPAEVRWCTPAEDGTAEAGVRFDRPLSARYVSEVTE